MTPIQPLRKGVGETRKGFPAQETTERSVRIARGQKPWVSEERGEVMCEPREVGVWMKEFHDVPDYWNSARELMNDHP